MAVIFPSEYPEQFLPAYPEWDTQYSLAALSAERGYEEDYPEVSVDPYEYYEGFGEYVRPEMDCN